MQNCSIKPDNPTTQRVGKMYGFKPNRKIVTLRKPINSAITGFEDYSGIPGCKVMSDSPTGF